MAGYSDFFKFKWQTLPEDMLEDLSAAYGQAIQSIIYQHIKSYADTIETWMRDNAPWEDETGAARAGLTAKAHLVVNEMLLLRLSHSVEYGTYLEGWNPRANAPMENAGQWSIIEPALDHWSPIIWNDLVDLVGGGNKMDISDDRVSSGYEDTDYMAGEYN